MCFILLLVLQAGKAKDADLTFYENLIISYLKVDWEITPKTLFLHFWNSILVITELLATQLEWRLQHFYVALLTPCW